MTRACLQWVLRATRAGGLLGSAVLVLFSGSELVLSHETRPMSRVPLVLPAEIAAYYAPASTYEALLEPADHGLGIERIRGRFTFRCPIEGAGREATFEFFPAASRPAPAVLIVPILAGGYGISRSVAASFVRAGMACLLVHRQEEVLDGAFDGAYLEETLRRSVHNSRIGIDWLAARKDVSRVGVIGISMGGIIASLLAATEPRVDRVVTVMAGGDLPDVVLVSWERTIRRYREARYARGQTPSGLLGELRASVRSDPLRLAPYVDPARVLAVMTRFDRHVPTEKQRALWMAMGRPRAITVPTGHYTCAIFFDAIMERAARFLTGPSRGP